MARIKHPINKGDKYGYLTLTGITISRKGRRAQCECICGKIVDYPIRHLTNGNYKSCGCKKGFGTSSGNKVHGYTKSKYKHRLYSTWTDMKYRCLNTNNVSYHNYGGRGIKVCDFFMTFQNFADWALENGWEPHLTLDREDNNGNYEPSNCRWVSMSVQLNNRRGNRNLTAFGETKTITEWSRDKRCQTTIGGLYYRILKQKLSAEEAIKRKHGQ